MSHLPTKERRSCVNLRFTVGTHKTFLLEHNRHTVSDGSERLRMAETPEQGNSRLSQAQAQVGEVVDIMRVNVEKVLERDSKLSELDQRADNLQEGANQFQTQVCQ